MTRLENVAGDIEVLADRLARIGAGPISRSARTGWRTAKWAERTRPVEARLSDASERLTQQFVDRRTAVLVRDIGRAAPMRCRSPLPPTAKSASVEPIGHLAGFVSVDPARGWPTGCSWRRQNVVSVSSIVAQPLCEAPDTEFQLVEEAGGLAIGWEGHILARWHRAARCSSRRCARRGHSTGCRQTAMPGCAADWRNGSTGRSTVTCPRSSPCQCRRGS